MLSPYFKTSHTRLIAPPSNVVKKGGNKTQVKAQVKTQAKAQVKTQAEAQAAHQKKEKQILNELTSHANTLDNSSKKISTKNMNKANSILGELRQNTNINPILWRRKTQLALIDACIAQIQECNKSSSNTRTKPDCASCLIKLSESMTIDPTEVALGAKSITNSGGTKKIHKKQKTLKKNNKSKKLKRHSRN